MTKQHTSAILLFLFSLNGGSSLLYNVKVAWCYEALYKRYFKWNAFMDQCANDKLADKCSMYSDILLSIYRGTSLPYINVKVAWH